MRLSSSPTDAEILSCVERWIDLLAEGKTAEALSQVQVGAQDKWTASLLEQVITGYGLPSPHPSGKKFSVTPRGHAQGGPPRSTVERTQVPLGVLAYVEHDLPLNDKWSDLTATFMVNAIANGSVIVLQEVHVL